MRNAKNVKIQPGQILLILITGQNTAMKYFKQAWRISDLKLCSLLGFG